MLFRSPKNAPLVEDAQKVAEQMFGDKPPAGQAAVAEMVKSGDLKPASALPQTATKPGTIGKKRAQRIYTLCTQNKKVNGGLDEKQIKRILAQWEPALEHLSDLPVDDYQLFEQWSTGEADWTITWGEGQ